MEDGLFYNIMALKLITAYFLDLLIGDPHHFPHPVKGMGKLIDYLEKFLKNHISNQRLGGVFLAMIVVGSTYIFTYLLLKIAGDIDKWVEFALGSFLIFTAFSTKSLWKESLQVYRALKKDEIELAREKLSLIVGRDTQNLNDDEIIRATVETIAENSVDGVVSPLFYAALGGAPLVLAFKAISTLDSMVGYKNEKYIYFGWFSARLDDVANFIPARISALLIPVASFILREKSLLSFQSILRSRNKLVSPNAGLPEAGFAGALGIQLGGKNFYQGKEVYKPLIGVKLKERDKEDILGAIHLMFTLSVVLFLGEVSILWCLQGLF